MRKFFSVSKIDDQVTRKVLCLLRNVSIWHVHWHIQQSKLKLVILDYLLIKDNMDFSINISSWVKLCNKIQINLIYQLTGAESLDILLIHLLSLSNRNLSAWYLICSGCFFFLYLLYFLPQHAYKVSGCPTKDHIPCRRLLLKGTFFPLLLDILENLSCKLHIKCWHYNLIFYT